MQSHLRPEAVIAVAKEIVPAVLVQLDGLKDSYQSMCLINPRRACAARVTVVGLSVCVSTFYLALRGGLLAIPMASELYQPVKLNSDFPETTAFEG